ncbi:MAG: hypothetical protein MO846_01830 [Candidatus Devosia symbiotica]|nr:hypothetical protein [Candidatus Devosia symbiotica]
MPLNRFAAIAVAALLTSVVVDTFAQDAFVAPATPEAAATARQALMKQNDGALKAAKSLSGAEAEAEIAMQTLVDNFTHTAALLPQRL